MTLHLCRANCIGCDTWVGWLCLSAGLFDLNKVDDFDAWLIAFGKNYVIRTIAPKHILAQQHRVVVPAAEGGQYEYTQGRLILSASVAD